MALKDISGKTFGWLTVIDRHGTNKHRHSTWNCVCLCGNHLVVNGLYLRVGDTTSCGCRKGPAISASRTTHGHAKKGEEAPEYHSWMAMLTRVSNPNRGTWKDYGARGITVCDRWRQFENFLADMGSRPSGTSLDRIDNEGGYEPGNCKWSTPKEQNNNRRPRRPYTKTRKKPNSELGGLSAQQAVL